MQIVTLRCKIKVSNSTSGLAMNAVRRSLNVCFVRLFCSAVRWTGVRVRWTVFGVRRCCRLCFVRLSSDDPCSVRSVVRQGWVPSVLFFVLFGKLCFVRSYVEFPFMQGLFGSGLCSAYLALFSLLLLMPVLFCILFAGWASYSATSVSFGGWFSITCFV